MTTVAPIGVRHDARLWKENLRLLFRIKPWEYGLGDKGYVGCPQIITEWKGDGLTRRQIEFNLTALPRACRAPDLGDGAIAPRAEHALARLVLAAGCRHEDHRAHGRPTGAYEGLRGTMCTRDVYGPWPVCPFT